MKQKKIFIIYSIVLSLAVLSIGGFYIYKTINQNTNVDKTTVKKDSYYSIRKNATELQKELYTNLETAIDAEVKNEKEINDLLAQNFIADFYTWNNKLRRNDVGGLQFVDESIRNNVYLNAKETFYNDFYYYLDKKQGPETLQVKSLNVLKSEPIDYFIFDTEGEEEIYDEITERYVKGAYHDAYLVRLSWEYESSTALSTSDYDNSANVIIMNQNKELPMIVEVNHNEEN